MDKGIPPRADGEAFPYGQFSKLTAQTSKYELGRRLAQPPPDAKRINKQPYCEYPIKISSRGTPAISSKPPLTTISESLAASR